jgi:predicted alpha/beta superfamily hydrolase
MGFSTVGRSLPKKLILAGVVACVVTAVLTTIAVKRHYEQTDTDPHRAAAVVRSTVLSEQRGLIVSLPESYQREPTRHYPVLYVLDGSSHTTPTAESARLLARIGVMPEIIVIGIPSSSENRARDYTPPYMRADAEEKNGPEGQADRFLRFIETELIPHVDRAYRTTSTRMLAGSSRGGLFVMYSLLQRPDLFSARFAYSPALWRDDDRIVTELARSLKKRAVTPTFLYLSLGDGENAKMTRAFRKTVEVVRTSASPVFRWRADLTRGADHGDNAVLSTPVALREYFRESS